MTRFAIALVLSSFPLAAFAVDVGDDADLTAAAVTARSCAERAIASDSLEPVTTCPVSEVKTGFVVLDVSEMQAYELSSKKVRKFELEKAFRGGSIDLTGKVVKINKGLPVIEVADYTVTAKRKAGAFKGCL